VKQLLLSAACACIVALCAASADAARLAYGTQDHIKRVADIQLDGPKGEQLYLGRRVAMDVFMLPYAVRDGGLVLGVVGDSSGYFNLPDATRLEKMQAAGLLPDPLPKSELDYGDLIFGYSLWWVLSATVMIFAAVDWVRRRRIARVDASA
jgi:hypothetical protein